MTSILSLLRPHRVVRNCTSVYNNARTFAVSSQLLSGHNRWSKIKHDKGKADDAKNKARSILSKELYLASKLYGPNPQTNPRLNQLVTVAKKTGFPKTSIDSAIARGQGISPSGASLESLAIEFLLPDSSIAAIVECQTDNKARTRQDIREILKFYSATITPTQYMFERRGKVVFELPKDIDEGEVLDKAIDAGALDVEMERDEEGIDIVIISTEASEAAAVGEKLGELMGVKPRSQDLVWEAKEDTSVEVEEGSSVEDSVGKLVAKLEDDASVQGVYLNIA